MIKPDETRWWWVRHAPVISAHGRIYGQTDLDADCSDKESFEALARLLPDEAVWITSNLKRTHQTAASILEQFEFACRRRNESPVSEECAFAEIHLGAWQGLTEDEIQDRRRHLGFHSVWLATAHERPEGGESFIEMVARVRSAVMARTVSHPKRDIIAVAHAGVIRAALAIALDLNPEAALAFRIDNCSITRIDHVGQYPTGHPWRVQCVNLKPGSPNFLNGDTT